MTAAETGALGARLRGAWSRENSSDPEGWPPANPARVQCAVTTAAVRDLLGGEVVWGEAKLPDGRRISHHWNRLPGGDLDLTGCQFPEGTRLPPGGPRKPEVDTHAYVPSHPVTRARYEALIAPNLRAAPRAGDLPREIMLSPTPPPGG